MALSVPKALPNEYPAAYAHRIGQWYLSWNKPDKALGQFFTPLSVARFMAELLPVHEGSTRVLDAGAGMGILACAFCESSNSDIELEERRRHKAPSQSFPQRLLPCRIIAFSVSSSQCC